MSQTVATSTDSAVRGTLQSIATPSDESSVRLRPYDASPKFTFGTSESIDGTRGGIRHLEIAPVGAIRRKAPIIGSLPIQIWEGTVIGVNSDADTMDVMLEAKMGHLPRHAATISLEWVPSQDIPLVKLGAVFYLTLYKQSERSTVKNAQEIRFRRLPSWSKQQIQMIQEDTLRFSANIEP
jgi:hypothetical protein